MARRRERTLWASTSAWDAIDDLIAEVSGEAYWLVAGPLIRDRIEARLTRRHGQLIGRRVRTWDALWADAAAASRDGPGRLSTAGRREVLLAAIDASLREGRLARCRDIARTPGNRDRLARLFDSWTRAGRGSGGATPSGADDEEWTTYLHYRGMVRALGVEDAAGQARWAAENRDAWRDAIFPDPAVVVVPDAGGVGVLEWQVLEGLAKHVAALHVTLAYEEDAARDNVFADVRPRFERLKALRFRPREDERTNESPAALHAVHAGLFREALNEVCDAVDGLRVMGMPEGEGEALAAAKVIHAWLERGVSAAEIEVCVPRWDERWRLIEDTLEGWGIAVACDAPRTLAADPGVAALLLALRVAAAGWPRAEVAQLLRHGRVTLPGRVPKNAVQDARVMSAGRIRDLRVFRGASALRSALARQVESETGTQAGAGAAFAVFDDLVAILAPLEQTASWDAHLLAARSAADALGIVSSGDANALDALFTAMEDQIEVKQRLGLNTSDVSPREFAREVRRVARELDQPARGGAGRGVLLTAMDAGVGPVDHRVVVGLAEGTAPARDVVGARAERGEEGLAPDWNSAALGREMRRFLDLFRAGGKRLALVYPTTDEKGQELLAAGFLEDLRRLFDPRAWAVLHSEARRLDAVLPDEYCGDRGEARVRAVALGLRGEAAALVDMAGQAAHRPALAGVATALRVGWSRARGRRFGLFEGQLSRQSAAAARIAQALDGGEMVLSPSQLESYAQCPYQFFMRYLVRVKPAGDRGEFQEDYAERGQILHGHLEQLHRQLKAEGGLQRADLPAAVKDLVEVLFREHAAARGPAASDVDQGLRQIENERLRRIVRRYVEQLARYVRDGGAEPEWFEEAFGRGDTSRPPLLLGGQGGARGVLLRGTIDRIDIEQSDTGPRYRVIDYKTGAAQTGADIKKGLALQLALYTIAAEDLILREAGAAPRGAGYWNVAKKGFEWALPLGSKGKAAQAAEEWWPQARAKVIDYVERLAAQMRAGAFPVAPRTGDCDRYCEYRGVCRIRQVRPLEKTWPEQPRIDWSDDAAGKDEDG